MRYVERETVMGNNAGTTAGSGAIYGLGIFGAWVYYWQQADGLWEYAYDKYWYVPLFGLNWVHGATTRFQWTPRIDGLVLFTEMDITN